MKLTSYLRPLVRFRLRTLLVVMTTAAILCGWLGRHAYRKSIERPIVDRVTAKGGRVLYDFQRTTDGSEPLAEALNFPLWADSYHYYSTRYKAEWLHYDPNRTPSQPALLRKLLGDDYFASIEFIRLLNKGTDDDIEQMTGLPALKQLTIGGSQITATSIEHLLSMPRLEVLTLDGTRVTPLEFAQLSGQPELRKLMLMNQSADDDYVQTLGKFRQLEVLTLYNSNANHNDIQAISSLNQLKELHFIDCNKIDYPAMKHLESLTNLEVLTAGSISGGTLAESSLASICKLPQLRKLSFYANIGDKQLPMLLALKNLEHLDIRRIGITDESASTLVKFRNLKHLNVSYTKLTNAGLMQLTALEKLKYLEISLDSITQEEARQFQQSMPTCHVAALKRTNTGGVGSIDLETGEITDWRIPPQF